MKKLILIFTLIISAESYSQGRLTGGNGYTGRSIRDDSISLIDELRRRNNITNNDLSGAAIIGGDDIQEPTDNDSNAGRLTGGNGYPPEPTDDRQSIDTIQDSQPQINSRQLNPNETGPNYKIDAPDTTQERTAPMHLYFDQIHFESDDVSEVTLKDGTVVKTEELQDFAKEVIMKKLNEQK